MGNRRMMVAGGMVAWMMSASAMGQVKNPAAFEKADGAVALAIAEKKVPGAVLIVGTRDGIVYRKAYGLRAAEPAPVAMTEDTVFDLASLTKSMATATSVMKLVEEGRIDVKRPVAAYFPEFAANGKDAVTVEDLLLHRGGLIADNPMADYAGTPEEMWARICALKPRYPAGKGFEYSDVGFIVLGKLVEKVSGRALEGFAAENIYGKLGMTTAGFRPSPELRGKIAPTEKRKGEWIVGDVHDPRAYAMGGAAGHAGLFGSADDVAKWCQMLLNGGGNVLSPATVAEMTRTRYWAGGKDGSMVGRAYGIDVDSSFSASPRGERFAKGTTFGHTGFTGTSYWIDPAHHCFVVLLTNRVHPDGKGNVSALRRAVATAAAEAFGVEAVGVSAQAANASAQAAGGVPRSSDSAQAAAVAAPAVLAGVDVLARDGFKPLAGRKVAIITNHSGRDVAGNRTVDLIAKAGNCQLVAIFSPEHGLFGNVDEKVGHSTDAATGLKVWSLYGETRTPSKEMLAGVDTLVYDIQDAGVRFYTYSATLGNCMRVAKEHGLKFVVLDRPNPLGGELVDGPIADEEFFGFTAFGPMPIVHGMTFGELAGLYNKEWSIGCDLTVVQMEGWSRKLWFDETGMLFVNPSPNLRNLTQEVLYPGIALVEGANISVGRGTDEPFETVGAPWVKGRELAAALNAAKLPGVRFIPIEFTPNSTKFKGQKCEGIHVALTNREAFEAVRTGITLMSVLHRLYPGTFELDKTVRLLQDRKVFDAVKAGQDPATIPAMWAEDVARWKEIRQPYLLYR